jgi:hypothetical protein
MAVKIFRDGVWVDEQIEGLNDIKKGIYSFHFHPKKSICQRTSENAPVHTLDEKVNYLNVGSFTNTIRPRLNTYARHWKYCDETNNCQNYDFNPRTISAAFERETTRYLLADLSTYDNAVVNSIKQHLIEIYENQPFLNRMGETYYFKWLNKKIEFSETYLQSFLESNIEVINNFPNA